MTKISPRDLVLLLIGLDGTSGPREFGGITRIQKLLFVLEAEENVRSGTDGFEFQPYKAGPYSPRIYDDLELLENLGFIRRAGSRERLHTKRGPADAATDTLDDLDFSAEASDPEKAEVDLSFEQLMGPEDVMAPRSDEIAPTADSYEEARYSLTERGKQRMQDLLAQPEYGPFVEGVRKVKSRFSKYSLNDLLYYVYTRHPKWTTESEIKEKVLRRRPT
jgi:hypothetical protein